MDEKDHEVLKWPGDGKDWNGSPIMMIVDTQKANTNRYACAYTHESNRDGKESEPMEIKTKGIASMFAALASTELILLLVPFFKNAIDDKAIFHPCCSHLVQQLSVYYLNCMEF